VASSRAAPFDGEEGCGRWRQARVVATEGREGSAVDVVVGDDAKCRLTLHAEDEGDAGETLGSLLQRGAGGLERNRWVRVCVPPVPVHHSAIVVPKAKVEEQAGRGLLVPADAARLEVVRHSKKDLFGRVRRPPAPPQPGWERSLQRGQRCEACVHGRLAACHV